MNEYPKTGGDFVSSQARIGVALNLPKTTAGDSVRELSAIGVINLKKLDTHVQAYKRGLTRYIVHPELLKVKQCKPEPTTDTEKVKAIFKQPKNKTTRHTRSIIEKWKTCQSEWESEEKFKRDHIELLEELNRDNKYLEIVGRIDSYKSKSICAIRIRDKEEQRRLEIEAESLKKGLRSVLKAHGVPPDIFPKGYFYIEI